MRKLMVLAILALAIAALPLVGITAEEEETGDSENVGMSADEAAAGSCSRVNLGSTTTEGGDDETSTVDDGSDANILRGFTDNPVQRQPAPASEDEGTDAVDGSSATPGTESMIEQELPCEPPKPDNTVVCYDGDTPLNCNIVNNQYICP